MRIRRPLAPGARLAFWTALVEIILDDGITDAAEEEHKYKGNSLAAFTVRKFFGTFCVLP